MNSNTITEIQNYARIIDEYATRRGIGLRKLVSEFPVLASVKTFSDLREGRLDGYDVEKHVTNYKAVADHVKDMEGGREEMYAGLPAVGAIESAVVKVMKSWGLDRVVFVDAESGAGKTTAAKILCAKYGSRLMMIEATDMWNDSPRAFLSEMLIALGVQTPPMDGNAVLTRVRELLRASRRCMIIDEAHHLGPRSLNVLKTLVNQTQGEFILIGIPSMWQKLYKAAYMEARQLSTNRLSERVTLPFEDRDVAAYLLQLFPDADKAELKNAARVIRPAAQQHGLMSFVRDVAREMLDDGLSADNVIKAVTSIQKRR